MRISSEAFLRPTGSFVHPPLNGEGFVFRRQSGVVWSLFFFSSRRRHTSSLRDWSSDVCSSDLWGAGVHDECGIGLPPDQVEDTDSNPLHESVALIADALGIPLDRTDNMHEPYVSSVRREHAGRVVEPGHNAGFHKRSVGMSGGQARIEIEMYGVFCIDPDVDSVQETARVVVDGDVTVETEARGNWFGDSYPVTAAKAIRAVRPLRSMPPGLYRPDQLPLSGSGQYGG